MRDDDAPLDERAQVVVGQMDTVRGDEPLVEQPEAVEVFDGRAAEAFADDAHLVAGLRHVGHHPQAEAVGQLAAPQQVLGRDGVGRVGRHGNLHAQAAGSGRRSALNLRKDLVDVAVEVVAAQHRADAHPLGHLDAAVLVVVHVDERGDTPEQHLDDAQRHAQRHVVGRLAPLEGPDVVVEPLHEGDVVGVAPLERHRRVAVGVDQTRHDQLAAAVEEPRVGMRRQELVGAGISGLDPLDAVADDADPAREVFRCVRLHRHGQHGRVSEENRCHKKDCCLGVSRPAPLRTSDDIPGRLRVRVWLTAPGRGGSAAAHPDRGSYSSSSSS